MSVVSACLYVCLAHNTYMLIFWICTACGGADVIRILKYDDEDSDKENVDPNVDPIVINDDDDDDDDESSTMSAAAAARGQVGRPWWLSAGLVGDGSAASSMSAGLPSDADILEGRVLHLRYIYQLSMEQRIQLIIKEIMQGT